jgi:hypothetical protein
MTIQSKPSPFFRALAEAIFGAPMPVNGSRLGTPARKIRPTPRAYRANISPAHSSSIRKLQRRARWEASQ